MRELAANESLTYPEVGATRDASLPAGYRHLQKEVVLGVDAQVWNAALEALKKWSAHTNAGVAITPVNAPLAEGTVVVASTRVGPLWVVAPCRITYITTQADRFGFAYGTLPGHPEDGEEAFHIVRDRGGIVRFEITAFSRPASPLARLGGPISTALQDRATRRYLAGLQSAIGRGAT